MIMLGITAVLILIFLIVVGLKSRNLISSNDAAAIVMAIIILPAVCISVFSAIKPIYSFCVKIEATGEKSVDARGSDVGIRSISNNGKSVDLKDGDFDDTWRQKDNSLVWDYSENNILELFIPVYAKTDIVFGSNVWAGIVKVTYNNHTDSIDLYSAKDERLTYSIPRMPYNIIVSKMLPVLFIMLFVTALVYMICRFICVNLLVKYLCEPQDVLEYIYHIIRERPYFISRIFLVVLSFTVMLIFADDVSLWADDLATISFVSEEVSIRENINLILDECKYNPPLFYIIAWLWLRIAPYGTVWLKLPSIIFSCIGIWLCGTAAKKLQNDRAALIATIFSATSIFLVKYAAYTFRSFGLLFMLSPLLIISYYNRLKYSNRVRCHFIFGMLLALLLYTNYICVLIFGFMGLYDCWLFARKKIRFNFVFSYIGAGALFLPLIAYTFTRMVESHKNFWPQTPSFSSLLTVVNLLGNNQKFNVILFIFAFFIVSVLPYSKKYESIFKTDFEKAVTIFLCAICPIFVVGFSYIYSRYVNPSGSIFVTRYFISVLTPFVIVGAIAVEWIFSLLEMTELRKCSYLITAMIVGCLLLTNLTDQVRLLSEFAGVINEPYRETIDYIHEQKDARLNNYLVIMTGYSGGFYYYGTHGGKRENLNFGSLSDSNWELYDVVFVSPMHGEISAYTRKILDEHYKEVENKKSLKLVKYIKNESY